MAYIGDEQRWWEPFLDNNSVILHRQQRVGRQNGRYEDARGGRGVALVHSSGWVTVPNARERVTSARDVADKNKRPRD